MTEGWVCVICGSSNSPLLLQCVCTNGAAAETQTPASETQNRNNGAASETQNTENGGAVSPSADVVALEAKTKPRQRKKYLYNAPGWDEFWSGYPAKLDKRKSYNAYCGVVDAGAAPEVLAAAARRYADYCRINGVELRHIKYAQGWLNDERWKDELVVPDAAGESDPAWTFGTPEYADRVEAEENAAIHRMAEA